MKQPPIALMVDNKITNNFLVPEHNYTYKSNRFGKSSSLIIHSVGVATIILSDDSQHLKIQVRKIDIVIKFKTFIKKACEWYCVCPHNSCPNETIIHRSFHCFRSQFWYIIRQLWSIVVVIFFVQLPLSNLIQKLIINYFENDFTCWLKYRFFKSKN